MSPTEPRPPAADGPPDAEPTAAGELTRLLAAARGGDAAAAGSIYDHVYAELKRLARAQLGAHGRVGPTLDTTALVHEAYLRLMGPSGLAVADRAHFFNLAARVMRHVIVDAARRRDAARRGGDLVKVTLDEGVAGASVEALAVEVLELDAALAALEESSPELARMVELRFFAGLEIEELVPMLGRSERSLKRDWRRARAFLQARLAGALPERSGAE
jgi:RNA polymerase sigma factor (TIGR02999 family)